jgi:regulator of sirC expression with transglutaminase-like and TPR domain
MGISDGNRWHDESHPLKAMPEKRYIGGVSKMRLDDQSTPNRTSFAKLALVAAAIGIVNFMGFKSFSGTNTVAGANFPSPSGIAFESLLAMKGVDIQRMDIATMNLLCAEGLPGSDKIGIKEAITTLDIWTKRVSSETDRHLHKFRQNPSEFENSEAYFRILTLVTVLQQDFNVRYNPERIQSPDFSDSSDLFLHGLLTGKRQGTCVSMPVLYVAVGRRLGYPLKLVSSKAHLFARWESADGKDRFNIEATNQGLNCFPDDYYHKWPVPLTADEIARGEYLKSLSPAEELAVFLSTRGHCLETAGKLAEAQVSYAHAHALVPRSSIYLAFLAGAVKKEMPQWERVRVDLGGQATAK